MQSHQMQSSAAAATTIRSQVVKEEKVCKADIRGAQSMDESKAKYFIQEKEKKLKNMKTEKERARRPRVGPHHFPFYIIMVLVGGL